MEKKFVHRVDFQVTILVVIMVAVCSLIVYTIVYTMSYQEMLHVLHENADSIEAHIDENINHDVFTDIITSEDMELDLYKETYAFLNEFRKITGTKYLYTATKNADGNLIYHIDGLPQDDVDFRNVGDLIEPEFQAPLLSALEGNTIIPDDILSTNWGNVYVAYYPLEAKDGGIDAALGIEFPADSQYQAFFNIRIIVFITIIIICILSGLLARVLFKRISNPYFKDIYNTDSLTQLKNRNAFDTDVHNNIEKQRIKGLALVITDLNGLKQVNDRNGHKHGDFYIKACAEALVIDDMEDCIVYRIGGDEFATILPIKHQDVIETYMVSAKQKLISICKEEIPSASMSMGYAICQGNDLDSWEKVQQEADQAMYLDKRAFYELNKQLDGRK